MQEQDEENYQENEQQEEQEKDQEKQGPRKVKLSSNQNLIVCQNRDFSKYLRFNKTQ